MTAEVGARAALATLVRLEQMGPNRLRAVLHGRTPSQALAAVAAGRKPLPPPPGESECRISHDVSGQWQREVAELDPNEVLAGFERAGYTLILWNEQGYPQRLRDDPHAPLHLSVDGDIERMSEQTVAIVGTRNCSRAGYQTAYSLGHDLASAGVTVVSGLASGIDAAAHRGAVDAEAAAPVAVVGSGLDVVYPRSNAGLWREVAASGAILSEYALGAPPNRWHFPARNRIIAGLADIVVVVESPERGGSMITVEQADLRSKEVLAVPGPVQARACAGTNSLIYEGRQAARHADDVLFALGSEMLPSGKAAGFDAAPEVSGEQAALLEAFEWRPATADHLVLRSGLDLMVALSTLENLVEAGSVSESRGWFERVPGRSL